MLEEKYDKSQQHLTTVVQQIAQVRDLPSLMAIVRRAARVLTGADGATLVMRDNGQCHYADEDAIGPLWKGQRFPLAQCISGWTMLHAEPAIIEDIYADERIPHEAYRPTFVQSLCMVPIGRDEPIGAIGCYWGRRHLPTEAEVALQQALADATAVGITNIELYRQLNEARQEAELRAAEAQRNATLFRMAFEHAGAGIAHVALNGRWLRVNQKLCDILGYDRENFLRLTFQDITHPDDLALDLDLVGKLLAGELPGYTMEKRYMRRDGRSVWTSLTVSLVRKADGTPDYFISIIEDIEQRKRDELLLRQHALVFDSAQEGIVITDTHGCVIDANQSFERITEYSLDEIRGRHIDFLQSGRQDQSFYIKMWESIGKIGSWQGEVWNRRKNGDVYLEWVSVSAVRDAQGEPIAYVGTHIDVDRMHHVQSEMERLAQHDALTGLPNRRMLASRMEHAIARARRGGMGAVLFLDLDGFKQVNDRLGHQAGDMLLLAVAQRIDARLREADTLARLGGDEFVLVLEDLAERGDAALVAQSVIAELSRPFVFSEGSEASIGVSVGIALFPDDGLDVAQLLDRADRALYAAKGAGKGTYRFFDTLPQDRWAVLPGSA